MLLRRFQLTETQGTPEYEDACDDRIGCTFTPPSKIATSFCPAGQACCGVQTVRTAGSMLVVMLFSPEPYTTDITL
eukprot:COSAG02_NODE_6877_length_3312_cov_20.078743_7_plen_76_part_00